ncbi:4'-phosphopantetheinyl transferase AcpT [Enterobacter cloacae]|uniref:4'-phosphopantetheinyl transferase AcpT n=1 Tax=Enterobacter cloacae TaxID=550 RepID=A0AAW6NM25_ENTCL|nr:MULTISPECIES: 4'-phosphopantetheinyl transferase AcpT [Enterobacter]AIV31853.1 ACP synthase [Enterobacter cloacae]EKT9192115.1 4'-phosphopantetheinyl transferase AcpT [Enterobacter cloacae]EKU3860207.1 4'-phosphopantetheinyl transferase AcpT [Enterobacter cloacae]EKX4035088.1 4'-phosphopantetheinyl transferase AcpT [Enterobacter cloacae]EKX9065041.1 4'-phosphopantetheinyl transferase AcpT [Enterobacter cloacae]
MYQVLLGKISSLSTDQWAQALSQYAPQGAQRARWLAGRGLLSRVLAPQPLPEIVYREQGKPVFADEYPLWFSVSHSEDDIALIISDEGDVGCSLEHIRPQENWPTLANAVFSNAEHDALEKETSENKLSTFWRIWTLKKAILKQRGGHSWQMVSIDSSAALHSTSQCRTGLLSLAVCTTTPFEITASLIHSVHAELAEK